MPNNLPARIPVRAKTEIEPAKSPSTPATSRAENDVPMAHVGAELRPAAAGLILDRRALAFVVRFASRLASRAPLVALRGCLFTDGLLVATDLDVSLRALMPGARELGVLVPAEPLKRYLLGTQKPEVEIVELVSTDGRPFAVSVDGAILAGHDPREFPQPSVLFPEEGVLAQARFQTLEPVLVAAAIEESRKAMNAIFFQCCKNVAVATDGHRLHTLGIESGDDGDFLVPRKAIDLVENIRRATRATEVRADFLEHQAVFHVGTFDVAIRLETERFPVWEEIVRKQSKYALRVQKKDLLEALDRIAAVMNERGRGVRLRKVAEGLEIHGRKPDAGELTITIRATGWEEAEVIGVNLGYLHDAVRFAPPDELVVGITDENNPIKIADGPYLAIAMPIRLDKGEIP